MTPYEEGRAAAERHESFQDKCPYMFDKSGLDRLAFDAQMRGKMDDWFRGWKGWLDEHDLGFNFQPKGHGTRGSRTAVLKEKT